MDSVLGGSLGRVNGQDPAKRKKQKKTDMLRVNSANYRQWVKIDNQALSANAEREMVAAARER